METEIRILEFEHKKIKKSQILFFISMDVESMVSFIPYTYIYNLINFILQTH